MREILKVLPDTAEAHRLLGDALAAQQRHGEAIASLRLATRLNSSDADAWRELASQLLLSGDEQGADAAHAEELLASALDPRLQTAARALIDNDIPTAEHLLRERLKEIPNDSGALRMLAEVGGRLGKYDDALRCWSMPCRSRPALPPRGSIAPSCSIVLVAIAPRSTNSSGC